MSATGQTSRLSVSAMSHRDPLLARVVGVLLALGGILGLVSLSLPHPEQADDAALAVVDGVAFVAGALYLSLARHLRRWMVYLTLAGSSTLICFGIYFTGVAAGLYSWMFIWVVLVVALFYSRAALAVQLGWLLGCYAVVVSLVPDTAGYSGFTRWLLSAMALSVAAGVVSWLVARRRATEERADRFFGLSRDMLCTASADGYFVELNPAWTRTLGYSAAELKSRPFIDFVHPDDRARTIAEAGKVFSGTDTVYFQNRYCAKDGSWHWLDWSSRVDAQGLVYARATDVTEHKKVEAEREALVETLRSEARNDPLTRLPNRRWLAEELDRDVARATRQRFDLCAAMVDLDHFKQFNDRHGHPAGDKLLREAADAWRFALRGTDFLARYGGEEFVVLLPDCSLEDAEIVIERLRAATPAGQTCSAGVVAWRFGETPESLIARADGALYEAKAAGRNRTFVGEDRLLAFS
jgi:diguanylate cyclase (GGDEF)-like protein/PAS domain S-box-containing protein